MYLLRILVSWCLSRELSKWLSKWFTALFASCSVGSPLEVEGVLLGCKPTIQIQNSTSGCFFKTNKNAKISLYSKKNRTYLLRLQLRVFNVPCIALLCALWSIINLSRRQGALYECNKNIDLLGICLLNIYAIKYIESFCKGF